MKPSARRSGRKAEGRRPAGQHRAGVQCSIAIDGARGGRSSLRQNGSKNLPYQRDRVPRRFTAPVPLAFGCRACSRSEHVWRACRASLRCCPRHARDRAEHPESSHPVLLQRLRCARSMRRMVARSGAVRKSAISVKARSRSVCLCYKNAPFVASVIGHLGRGYLLMVAARGGRTRCSKVCSNSAVKRSMLPSVAVQDSTVKRLLNAA